VSDDEHAPFMALRLIIVTYNVWNKTFWMLFQITRGQWGAFVQPGSISCCFLWV